MGGERRDTLRACDRRVYLAPRSLVVCGFPIDGVKVNTGSQRRPPAQLRRHIAVIELEDADN